MTLVELLTAATGHRERCLIILYHRARTEGHTSLTTGEVSASLRQARVPRAKRINVSDVLGKAGELVDSEPEDGRGRRWWLTRTGEKHVEGLIKQKFGEIPRWKEGADVPVKRVSEVRLLFLGVSPTDAGRLRLDEECREITQRIRATEHRDALKVLSAWAVRPDDMFQYLHEHRPHVVHFSGHGSTTNALAFEENDGRTKPVTAAALSGLFDTMRDDIRLVVFNACHSGPVAEEVAQHIDCVVGMSDAVADETAIQFAAGFYRPIGFGHSVLRAFREARASLVMAGLEGDDVPQLFVRAGVNADEVILASEID